MLLPIDLRLAIEAQAATVETRLLRERADQLSERYRMGAGKGPSPGSDAERIAYLVTRFPGTYTAVCAVLSRVLDRIPELDIESLLDLGAGPGTVAWAVSEIFPAISRLTQVERDRGFVRLGRALAEACGREPMASANWLVDSITGTAEYAQHDAVVLSYVLGELDGESLKQVVRQAWAAARKIIVLIEPGSQRGFSNIIAARTELIGLGANLAAPCPHHDPCPLAGVDSSREGAGFKPAPSDWCHFAARLERTHLHRRLKSGSLPYEDEKFSYVAAAREPVSMAPARVIRHPMKLSGYVKIELCTREGTARETISRKEGDRYRRARKLSWGAEWEPRLESKPGG